MVLFVFADDDTIKLEPIPQTDCIHVNAPYKCRGRVLYYINQNTESIVMNLNHHLANDITI